MTEPLVFEPSSLLHHSKVNLPVAIRRGACAVACLAQDWDSIETIAQQAHRRWVEDGDWQSSAVALMHLGDDTLKAGNPTLVRKYYDLSRHLFSLRVAPTQRQNKAAALYGMGLAKTSLGHIDAAIERLEKARRDWLTLDNDNQAARCEKAKARLKTMIKRGVAQPAARLAEHSTKPPLLSYFIRNGTDFVPVDSPALVLE